ncbi:Meiotic recombination protein SPO11-2 [Acorus gramineus]|uniref:Meiotic recombination protein SPO11-2 n=1 Tax=Acorus gramineus TaxID=55184 RepID=A0AAV9ACL6_ACOGR|nr:Meiotic recombination protein SPO11-2 [Acorus gramineus]
MITSFVIFPKVQIIFGCGLHGLSRLLLYTVVTTLYHQLLGQQKQVTQRELFYKLICYSPDYFTSHRQVNRWNADIIVLLQCSHHSLGIMASKKDAVRGNPAGLAIICTYKFGSIEMGLEAFKYDLQNAKLRVLIFSPFCLLALAIKSFLILSPTRNGK